MTDRPPALARLFAIAYRSLVDQMHGLLRERGWDDVRPAYGFVLLAARSAPTTSTDLAALMGTTKQAASKLVDSMEAAGLVTRDQSAEDARLRPVALSARGRRLLEEVEAIYDEIEARWSAAIGEEAVDRLRADLVTVLTQPDGTLPPVRPTW
ncbi:MAG: MarR family transcriptional regulator [Nocardioidaceae bacterium]